MTLRTYLDAAYALAVEERVLASQGVSRPALVADLEKQLGEPLPDEVSAEELEMAYRRRQAADNMEAQKRMGVMFEMARSPRGA
jgi:hypothetical protein